MAFIREFLSVFGGAPAIQAFLGFLLVFFLPGFAWTFVLFRKLHIIERVALSFALSFALVTLSVIALNVAFDVRINGTNALLTIIVLTVIPAGIYLIKRLKSRRSAAPDGD